MKTKFLTATLLSLALVGCASTPSKPRTFDQLGRFNTYPMNAQTYRISFEADPNMNYGMAEEITLVKAAQTTLKNGFRYFKVLDDPSNVTQKPPRQAVVYHSPSFYPYGYYPRGYYRRYPGYWPDPFYDTPQVVNLDPVQVSYTIECYKDSQKAPSDAFDASLILQSLGQKYGVSPNGDVIQPQPTPPASSSS